jgi:hypothetical protein
MPYLTYSMLLYLHLHYNEIKLVDRRRIELLLHACKAHVLPLSLTAHFSQLTGLDTCTSDVSYVSSVFA